MDQFESTREMWIAVALFVTVTVGVLLVVLAIVTSAENSKKEAAERSARRRSAWVPHEEWTALRYGTAHQEEKSKYREIIAEHGGICMETVCVMPTRRIASGARWDLAHDHERGGHQDYLGPAHPECNEAEARSCGVTWD